MQLAQRQAQQRRRCAEKLHPCSVFAQRSATRASFIVTSLVAQKSPLCSLRATLRAAATCMAPRLPDDLAQLRALLLQVLSLIRSGRAALLAELAGLGGQAPAAANLTEPSAPELDCEESPAALQQLIRQALSHWYHQRNALEAAVARASTGPREDAGPRAGASPPASEPRGSAPAEGSRVRGAATAASATALALHRKASGDDLFNGKLGPYSIARGRVDLQLLT